MNLIPVIRESLGLQENEEFSLKNDRNVVLPDKFRFTDSTLQIKEGNWWFESHSMMLQLLFKGECKVVKLRFKPKEGEDYYFVDVSTGYVCRTTYGVGYRHDVVRIREALRVSSGNCYRTEEEAEKHVDEWMRKVYGENWKELLK